MAELTNNFNINMKLDAGEYNRAKMQAETVNKGLGLNNKQLKQNLDKDDFLKLLITELTHQDPTNPMQDREFIAQMAQFSSMEQMLNMNKSMDKLVDRFSFQSSFDLLGRDVEVTKETVVNDEKMSSIISGKVEAISKKGGDTFAKVNGELYPISDIVQVIGQ